MAIPIEVTNYLALCAASYRHNTHPAAFTAQDTARVRHIPTAEFAKTVVLRADERFIIALLPSDHRINLEVLKKLAGCTNLAIGTEVNRPSISHHGVLGRCLHSADSSA